MNFSLEEHDKSIIRRIAKFAKPDYTTGNICHLVVLMDLKDQSQEDIGEVKANYSDFFERMHEKGIVWGSFREHVQSAENTLEICVTEDQLQSIKNYYIRYLKQNGRPDTHNETSLSGNRR